MYSGYSDSLGFLPNVLLYSRTLTGIPCNTLLPCLLRFLSGVTVSQIWLAVEDSGSLGRLGNFAECVPVEVYLMFFSG